MSWRDGNRFNDFWKKAFPNEEFNDENSNHKMIRSAYNQGYSDGFGASSDYDPFWDADQTFLKGTQI